MKKHISLRTAIITVFVILAMLVILPIINKSGSYDNVFAQNDVVTEADCRMCHCYNVPDTHHQLVLSGTYECLNCHQIKLDDATQTYYTEVIRDCIACHSNVVGDRHHVLVQAGSYTCLDCHQMTFDNVSQQYIVELNFTCISGQSSNQPPIANAGPDQTVSAGQSVSFSGAGSNDPDGNITNYAWDFGDGSTGTGVTTSHIYNPGVYTVTLSVTDDKGAIGTNTALVTVNAVTGPVAAANKAPIANAGSDQTVKAGDTGSFNGTGSSDPDGSIVNYQWNFGDGYTGSGPTTTHTYNTPGTYTAILKVTDNSGATVADTATITVQAANQPPVANAGPDKTATAGATVGFSGSSSYDPDGTIASYAWSFGDGSTGTGVTNYYTYTTAGTHTVTLIVIDDKGATGTDTAIITVQAVANQPPVANAGPDQTVSAGTTVSFSGAGSRDPEGPITNYAWDFGDGSTGTGVTTSHIYNNPGVYTATLSVTDDKGTIGIDTAGITVNEVAEPVAAYADEVLRFYKLHSYTDEDSDDDIYNITSAFSNDSYSYSYRIRLDDEENEAISMRINEEAGRYSQVIISIYVNSLDGSSESIRIYPYQSNANYLQTSYYLDKTVYGTGWVDIDVTSLISRMNGYGWMKFRIVNRSNWMYVSEGYFTLYGAAANRSPIANAGSDQTVNAGNTVSFNGTGSSDPDGSIVNYQWNFGDGYTGSGSTTTHTYKTPGTYTVTLTVTDNKGATGTDTAMIKVQAAPVSTSIYADQVLWIQNLKYATSSDSYGSKTDITSRFKDNILTDTFTVYNHSDSYKVMSMKLNKDASLYTQVMIGLYVKALYDNHSQTIKIYPYNSDGNSINTSYYSTYTITKTGWTQIDLTSLASRMKGFGWMKFRLTCTTNSLDVSDGKFILR